MYTLRFTLLAVIAPCAALISASVGIALMPRFAWVVSMSCFIGATLCWVFATTFHAWVRASPMLRCRHENNVIIGGGWSFFLNKKSAPRGARVDHNIGHSHDQWWFAGTTIRQVQASLTRRGLTLCSYPSIPSATLGGWIFSNAHGSGGTLWTPQFDLVRVRDCETGSEIEGSAKQFFSIKKTFVEQRRYIVLAARLKTVPNIPCRRVAFRVHRLADTKAFLGTPSYLRLLQIGRRGTLALVWRPVAVGEARTPRELNLFSQAWLWLVCDAFSAWQSRADSPTEWFAWPMPSAQELSATVWLSDASDFSPVPIPLFAGVAFGYRNFELMADVALTEETLLALCTALEELMRNRGRCELRCGATRLFLDFACPMSVDARDVRCRVQALLGDGVPLFVHKGKALLD